MKSSASSDPAAAGPAPGRPAEIEEATNRVLIHPLARALVDRLIATPVTPNQVSIASVFMAGAAAICYASLIWPLNACAGLAFQVGWHVLDGADGDLARRTGRASTIGELVDGICDHVSQGLIYIAFAIILARGPLHLGLWAWALAVGAALSHFIQANAFETGRKSYRRWVYDATWIRQNLAGAQGPGPLQRLLGGAYLAMSTLSDAGASRVEAAMGARIIVGGAAADSARRLYRETYAPLIRKSAVLSGNSRTIAAFLSLLAGSPLWFFIFEMTALNATLGLLIAWRARQNARLIAALAA
ncbi:MAG TPA: CDP-alcohol phosphatidyltransferase family protein [Caulobacteraceae bacterium]